MKAENENLKDKILSEAVNSSFKEEGLSSNFTHQVLTKIEQLENLPQQKPLLSWWAWLIVAGCFISALVLAFIKLPMPETITIEWDTNINEYYSQYSSYVFIAIAVMAVFLVDMWLNRSKKTPH